MSPEIIIALLGALTGIAGMGSALFVWLKTREEAKRTIGKTTTIEETASENRSRIETLQGQIQTLRHDVSKCEQDSRDSRTQSEAVIQILKTANEGLSARILDLKGTIEQLTEMVKSNGLK